MKEFLGNCLFWVFIGFCAFVASCCLCSPLKGVGGDEVYNDIKDDEL